MGWNCLSTGAPRQSEIASRKSEAVSACLDDPFALETIAVQLSFTRPKPDRQSTICRRFAIRSVLAYANVIFARWDCTSRIRLRAVNRSPSVRLMH